MLTHRYLLYVLHTSMYEIYFPNTNIITEVRYISFYPEVGAFLPFDIFEIDTLELKHSLEINKASDSSGLPNKAIRNNSSFACRIVYSCASKTVRLRNI